MKILHLSSSLSVGGAEMLLFKMLTTWPSLNDVHCVISFGDGKIQELLKDHGVEVIVLKGLISSYDPVGLSRLFFHVLFGGYDVIHTSLTGANCIGRIIGFLCRKKVVSVLHGNPLHHGIFRQLVDLISWFGAARSVAVSKTVFFAYEALFAKFFPQWIARLFINRLVLIPNGVKVLEESPSFTISFDRFTIGAVGRLIPLKQYHVLLKAFARLVQVVEPGTCKLVFLGDGSERALLEALSLQLHVSQLVTFYGEVCGIEEFYDDFSVLVNPSSTEGMSCVVLEAMARGIIVIATAGVHDFIEHGVDGFLFSSGDDLVLFQLLFDLYKKKIDVSTISKNAHHKILMHYSLQSMVDQYRNLFLDLMCGKISI